MPSQGVPGMIRSPQRSRAVSALAYRNHQCPLRAAVRFYAPDPDGLNVVLNCPRRGLCPAFTTPREYE